MLLLTVLSFKHPFLFVCLFNRFDKRVRYASRKARADVRKRVKGRFIKAGEAYDYDPLNQARTRSYWVQFLTMLYKAKETLAVWLERLTYYHLTMNKINASFPCAVTSCMIVSQGLGFHREKRVDAKSQVLVLHKWSGEADFLFHITITDWQIMTLSGSHSLHCPLSYELSSPVLFLWAKFICSIILRGGFMLVFQP